MVPPLYTNADRPFNTPQRTNSFERGPSPSEADMSAPPIDDGSFISSDDPAQSANDRSSTPRSPQPRLVLFDARTGKQETIDLSSASSVMTLDDYKRLNRKTTERGMVTGLLGGGLLTYLVKRFMPKSRSPSRNALALTFIFSSSFISFSTSRALLVTEIMAARAKARQRAIDNGEIDPADTPMPNSSPFPSSTSTGSFGESTSTSDRSPNETDGGMFSDPAAVGDSLASLASPERAAQGQGAQQVYGRPAPRASAPRPSGAAAGSVGNVGLGHSPWNGSGSGGGGGGGGVGGVGVGEGEMIDPYASSSSPTFR